MSPPLEHITVMYSEILLKKNYIECNLEGLSFFSTELPAEYFSLLIHANALFDQCIHDLNKPYISHSDWNTIQRYYTHAQTYFSHAMSRTPLPSVLYVLGNEIIADFEFAHVPTADFKKWIFIN